MALDGPSSPQEHSLHAVAERKELWNTLTHGFGLLLSIVAAVILRTSFAQGESGVVAAACSRRVDARFMRLRRSHLVASALEALPDVDRG
jgi:hypothetical protein